MHDQCPPAAVMSPIYRAVLDEIVAGARSNLKRDGKLSAMGFCGQISNQKITVVPLSFSDDESKMEAIAHLRAVARIEAADFVGLVHEAWALTAKHAPHHEDIIRKYGSVSACPHRVEVVAISLETSLGVWMAMPRLRAMPPSKMRRTFDEPEFQFFAESAGLFTGLLKD